MDLRLLYSHSGEGEVFTTEPVTIPGIEGERPLTIYLPPDYLLNPVRLYSVAYLFDGQNLYDRAEWPVGWNLHHILDERAAAGREVPIVVGIHHGFNRDEELCPWPAEKGQTPRGDALLDWLVNELHPQLAQQLRIDDRPEQRMVGGSSLGGLLALYAGFAHSDFFGKVMSMSPSLWVGQGAIYEYIAEAAFLHNLDYLRLYIDCGALEADEDWPDQMFDDEPAGGDEAAASEAAEPEAEVPEAAAAGEAEAPDDEAGDEDAPDEDDEWETDPLEDAEYMVDILRAKGFIEGLHFQWIADPEGEHNEWHWSKRLPLAFAYLYDEDEEAESPYGWGDEEE